MYREVTKMSLQHFRKLYEIAKTDGVKAALKYDAAATVLDLVIPAVNLLHTSRIKGYKYVDEELSPPDAEGLSGHLRGYEPVYERVPFWKAKNKDLPLWKAKYKADIF
jgi:hypothetical protein